MKRKLILIGLWAIAIASCLGIIFYFFGSKNIGLRQGIPTVSDIFSPIIISPYVKQAEEKKTFYSQRLSDFEGDFNSVVSSKSSFVKTAEAAYTIGGTVSEISSVLDANNQTGYDITLKSLSGDIFVVHLSPLEAQFAKVFLRTPTSFDISRSQKKFSDIKVGDYLVIKRSTNLLNPAEVNIDVEILTD